MLSPARKSLFGANFYESAPTQSLKAQGTNRTEIFVGSPSALATTVQNSGWSFLSTFEVIELRLRDLPPSTFLQCSRYEFAL